MRIEPFITIIQLVAHWITDARLKLKLKKNWMGTATNRRKYNVGLLKHPQTRTEYKLNLANKFQVLPEQYEEELI